MKTQNHFVKYRYALTSFVISSILYFFFSISGSLYTYSDNMTVSIVASGMYGTHFMCQYIHPLFSVLVRILTPIIPTADAFALIVHAVLFAGVYLMLQAGTETFLTPSDRKWEIEDFIKFVLLILSAIFYCIGMNLWGLNYTVQTAAILFSGIVVLSYAMEKGKGRAWIVFGTILMIAGFLLRSETVLLFIPFICLEVLSDFLYIRDRNNQRKRIRRYLVPSIIAGVLILASGYLFWSFEPYASDSKYNEYRTIVEDYPMSAYSSEKGKQEGIDEITYEFVQNWGLTDTERINTETLEKIAKIGSKNQFSYTFGGLRSALKEMKKRVLHTDIHFLVLVIVSLLLTVWNLATIKSGWLKLETALAFFGSFLILLYFTFRGRALLRVWQCVFLAFDSVLISVLIKDNNYQNEKSTADSGVKKVRRTPIGSPVFMLLLCVALYFSVGQSIAHTEFHLPMGPLTSRVNVNDSAYEKTFEDDALYIWPNWYLAIPRYFSQQNKLPTQRVIDHNIAIGDWVYGQVYFRDFLQKINAENPAKALLERPNTYIATGAGEPFMNYMKYYYGENLVLKVVDKVADKEICELVGNNY